SESNNNSDPVFQVRKNASASGRGDLVMTANDDGNVGIGTSSPSEKFVVDGNVLPGTGSSSTQDWNLGSNSSANEEWDQVYCFNLNQGSDRSLKEGIDSLDYGLSHILKLNTYSYLFKGKNNQRRNLGLIAQEVDQVIDEIAIKGEGEDGVWNMRYIQLIPVLINGIQEQQKKIQNQEQEVQKLQKELAEENQANDELKERVDQLSNQVNQLAEQVNGEQRSFKKQEGEPLNQKTVTLSGEEANQAMLLQNRPNPYSNETVIPYYLPEDAQNANMLITNTQGQLLKRIPLEQTGKGELTLRTQNLKAGQYQYTLIVNGRKVQTRKMVIK
ncbi:MAG: hypothetical protein BRD49_06070, partial [Bacteroidetes bacterium SW_10_40_5]